MTRNRITATAAAFILMLAAFMITHVITFDHYAGAYGVSAGTDSHYCSIETAWPVLTCEHAS